MVGEDHSVTGTSGNNRGSAWIWFTVLGATVTIGYYILPVLHVDALAQSLIFIGVSTAAAIAVLVGVLINKPPVRFPWLVLAAAQTMYSIGDTVYFVLHTVLGREDYPDLADLFYLLQYPLICWALVIFIRRRTPGRDRIALIDAAVLAVPAGMVAWVFVISSRGSSGESLGARLVSAGYPMMDLLVLAVALRLVLGVGTRTLAYRLLITSLTLQLAADAMYVLTKDTYQDGSAIDAVWFGAYFLLGAAALHPSMRSLDRRSARTVLAPTRGRLALLGFASMLPLAVVVVRHTESQVIAAAVAGGVTFLLIMARMSEQIAEQRALAINDGLTGVYAGDFFDEAVLMECERARYSRGELSVLLVGVDNIKLLNGMYGNTGGDLVLREIAVRLRLASRPGDLVARRGGDKFLVLLPNVEARQVPQLAERMREAVPATHIDIGAEARVRVTVSIGLATMPADGLTPPALLHAADQGLYAAKRAGRNRTYTRGGPVAGATTAPPLSDNFR
ncbi:MAG TPA: GGDEF domain-containing protein [Planosporangium sp.]|jgi:diguanylate cyclase (GGDEF)-like protein|nr:GGDEF domain-containing protein [Planosporangium sp.]